MTTGFEDDNIPVLAMFPEIEYWSMKKVPAPESEKRIIGLEYQYWIFNANNNIAAFLDTKGELKIYINDQVMWTPTGRTFAPTPTQLERAVRYAWLRLQSVKS